MQTGPIKFTNPKWQPLSIYFENVTYEDLADLTQDSMVMATKKKHHILMDLFVKQELHEYIGRVDPYRSKWGAMPIFPSKPATIEECLESLEYLDLRNRVVTARFPHCAKNLFGMKDLVTMEIPHPETIEVVDLSRNNLLESDMPYIVKLVQRLPKCHTVVLSQNRLYEYEITGASSHHWDENMCQCDEDNGGCVEDNGGCVEDEDEDEDEDIATKNATPMSGPEFHKVFDDALLSLLKLPQIKYVDITGTQVASIQRKDLHAKLTPEEYGKLIWIEERWLLSETSGWRGLLSTRETLVEPVMKHHQTYYRDVKPQFPPLKPLEYRHD